MTGSIPLTKTIGIVAVAPISVIGGSNLLWRTVQFGLVASFNRPGGNITGVSFLTADLGAKRLGLLHEFLPKVSVAGILVKQDNPNAESITRDAREAARLLGLQLHVLNARTAQDIDAAFVSLVQQQAGALLVSADPFFTSRYDQFVRLASRHAVPTIYYAREFVTARGLMSYGTSISNAYRQAGVYIGKILKGA